MNRGLEIPKVKDILVEKVIAFQPDHSTLAVINVFNERRISSAPVVNEKKEIVGYISESDLMKCVANCLFFDEQKNTTVESIMSKNVLAANSNWDIFELDNFFISKHIKSAPVIDEDGHLAWIITRRDTLKALEKLMVKRATYKTELKNPIELSPYQTIKIALANKS